MSNQSSSAKIAPIVDTTQELTPFEFELKGVVHKIKPVLRHDQSLSRIPIDCLPINMPLPCPLYAKVGNNYIMFRVQKDEISGRRIKSLISKGTNSIYIPKKFWEHFMKSLEDLQLPVLVPFEDRLRHLRALLLGYIGNSQKASEPPKEAFFNRIKSISDWLAKMLYYDPSRGLKFLRRNPDPSLYFENHAINSGIYSALMGKSLNYPIEHISLLVYGGILHDIGNAHIPKEILFKEGKLTPSELDVIKTHPKLGAELLKSVGAEDPVVLMALQHHERVDKMGYPLGVSGKEIHPFAKIVAIADVYDAITCNRPHQKGLSPKEAMRRMRAQEGLFDLDFLGKISFSPNK